MRKTVLLTWVLPILGCGASVSPHALSKSDSTVIAAVQARYVEAWLADDTTGVLATLDSGAVLLPPGRESVTGHSAIRAYWWPADGSHTRITGFTWDVTEVLGGPGLAVARGISTVSWSYAKDTVLSQQTVRNVSLSVLTKNDRGEWRIARQMWGPALK
jgi:ketosteroid isomerase-like protein